MVYVTGDTHGMYYDLKERFKNIELTCDDTIIICGDFGFVWNETEKKEFLKKLSQEVYTIAFVDGNHEDFSMLNEYPVTEWNGGKVHKVAANIYHLMRGQLFSIEGKTYFTMGGAYSLDKYRRVEGIDWWKEELPNSDDYKTADKTLTKCGNIVDYVITHTLPQSSIHYIGRVPDIHDLELTGYLDWLYDKLEFKKWFAGHFHVNKQARGNVRVLYDDVVRLDY